MFQELVEKLFNAMLVLDYENVKNILLDSINNSENQDFTSEELLIESQKKFGELWVQGDIALSQVYMAGKICEDVIEEISPNFKPKNLYSEKIYTVVLEDFHILGKKMLDSILRIAGFKISDYGFGISVEALLEKLKQDNPQLLLISTLMLNSALRVKVLVDEMKKLKLRTKVIVGGAPFNIDSDLWKNVGADGYAPTATKSIEVIKQLLGLQS